MVLDTWLYSWRCSNVINFLLFTCLFSMPTNKPHKFIVVIHLLRTPSRLHSCKEAAGYGRFHDKMAIFIKGKKIDVVCD